MNKSQSDNRDRYYRVVGVYYKPISLEIAMKKKEQIKQEIESRNWEAVND